MRTAKFLCYFIPLIILVLILISSNVFTKPEITFTGTITEPFVCGDYPSVDVKRDEVHNVFWLYASKDETIRLLIEVKNEVGHFHVLSVISLNMSSKFLEERGLDPEAAFSLLANLLIEGETELFEKFHKEIMESLPEVKAYMKVHGENLIIYPYKAKEPKLKIPLILKIGKNAKEGIYHFVVDIFDVETGCGGGTYFYVQVREK